MVPSSPVGRRRLLPRLVLACAAWLATPAWADTASRVLVLYSNSRPLPANVAFSDAFDRTLHERSARRVELLNEYLDSPRFGGEAYEAAVTTYLRAKYAAQPPEVIVAGGEAALKFLLGHRAELFPQVPVVHAAVERSILPALGPLPPGVIGTPVDYDFLRTMAFALRWHPQATRLVLVTGTSPWGRAWEARLRDEARRLPRPIEIVPLAGLPAEAVLDRLRALGPESIVFTPGWFRDGSGRIGAPRESVVAIAAATRAPVYGPFSTFIGTGIVGGVMTGYEAMGQGAAQRVAALLDGRPPAAVPVPAELPMAMNVDWRALRRAGVPPDALPADAVVRFREPTFWEAYGHFVLIAAAVLMLQAALIVGLLVERVRRRRTAVALARSEQRLKLAADAARMTTWSWEPPPAIPTAAAAHDRRGGAEAGAIDFGPALARIHPDDRAGVVQAVREALRDGREFEVEYRVAEPDGELRWQAARGRAADGGGRRLVGVAFDITPRKRAEEQAAQDRSTLRHLTRVSLLGQMSASIAHQLNQPLASILANAEAALKMLGRTKVDLDELRAICADIVAADHRAAEVIRRLGALFKRGELVAAALDLNALVRDTLDLTRTELLMRHVAVETELAAQPGLVDGDRVQLQQMLLNLIVNAADAMADGPEPQRRLTLRTAQAGGEIRVVVADRGPGIPEAERERIFDPFWSTKHSGMGVGLAICRSIVAAHRGRLEVSDAPGGGAVFCAILPARPT